MPFTPIERKAAFMAAVTLKETTKTAAAEELEVSWTHLEFVLDGVRVGSTELKEKIADYVGIPSSQFWKEPIAVAS